MENNEQISQNELEKLANLRIEQLYNISILYNKRNRILVKSVTSNNGDKKKFQEENLQANLTEIEHIKLLGELERLKNENNLLKASICGYMESENRDIMIILSEFIEKIVKDSIGIEIEVVNGIITVLKKKV